MAAEKTIEELEEAIAGATEPQEQAEAMMKAAYRHYRTGNYPRALQLFEKAVLLCETIGDKEGLVKILLGIGAVHSDRSDNKLATEFVYRALHLAEETGDEQLIAAGYNDIAVIHHKLGNHQAALEFYNKALPIREKGEDKLILSGSEGNIAAIHLELGDYYRALDFFKRSLDFLEKAGNKDRLSRRYNNIGAVYEKQGNHELALEYYHKALQIRKEENSKNGIAFSLHNIGFIYKKQADYTRALEYLLPCLVLAEEIGHKQVQAETLKMLYEIKKAQSDAAAALAYHEKHVALKDEINNTETSKQIANLKVGYELELNEKERKLIESILFNILPPAIAGRIKSGEEKIIERFDNASILFADIVGFTTWSAGRDVNEIGEVLDELFHLFDMLADKHKVEKIKTIGDAYMCVAGLPEPCEDHALRIAGMALAMNEEVKKVFIGQIQLRIGLHSGEVIAGVLGKNKYAYDLWGDTVNTASRMESHGVPGRIQITEEFKKLLGNKYQLEERGEIEVKGKGKIWTWFLNGSV